MCSLADERDSNRIPGWIVTLYWHQEPDWPYLVTAGDKHSQLHTRSKMPAAPMPVPTHMVTMP